MLTRRAFIRSTAVAGAAVMSGVSRVTGATYDLLIKGGRLLDPIDDQVFDFPNVLSRFLLLGMPLDQVIAMGTANAARFVPGFGELGTLRVGAPADVAVLELREGEFEFVDNYKGTRTGTQKLFPAGAVIGGKRI